MKLFLPLIAALIIGCIPNPSKKDKIAVDKLTCEYKADPLGISSQTPRLGWQLSSAVRGQSQSAYQILVSDDPELLKSDKGDIWDSKKTVSGNSILVSYAGSQLASGEKYFWKVKVWDKDGNESLWSKTASWQMGLLSPADWAGAKWIGYEDMPDSLRLVPGIHQSADGVSLNKSGKKASQRPVVPLFRKGFQVTKKIKSASLYITGLGQYEASLNGKKIGDAFLTPGWTYYDKTILYNTYDVTSYLQKGDNALGVTVGNGFYNINRERYRKLIIAFGMPKMIARLNIKYDDGTEENIVSDAGWKTSPSPISFTSIYGGEDYDAQLEQKGWDSPGFSDSAWKDVLVVKHPEGKLIAEADYLLAVKERFGVKKIQIPRENVYLYDFGQNASGIVELKVKGKKGQEVRLIPAELITKNNLANQKASGSPYYFSYTLKGDGIETWRPRFTYYGFRYVQVEGAVPDTIKSKSDLPKIVGLEMLHTRNSTPEAGKFECSNQLFNRINALIDWAIKSNLQSVVTDCPHREKLGWLEQTLLMGGGIHYNFDLFHLYTKQVEDMIETQTADGLVPDIAPEYVVFEKGFRDSPEWGSASVVLPWMVYKWYGDISLMEKAWPMMIKYVEYLKSKSKDNIVSHGLGDWFDYGPKRPGPAQLTPMALTATAIYYYDLKLLTDMAELLGKKDEEKRLSAWADEVKQAFNKEFFNEKTCVYSTGSQTAMSMPLCFGLVDNQLRGKVVENLVDSIKKYNKALTAGDVGFHYLVQALTEGGASQLLFEMNNRDDVPGYGFQLKKGATALTESWPALEEVSNNHLMLGHIMEWFYTGLGGISQEENSAAYKEISIHPDPVGDITEAKTSYQSPYGLIECAWQKKNNIFTLTVDVPVNATANVYFPVKEIRKIKENSKPVEGNKEFEQINSSKNESVLKVGSANIHLKLISIKLMEKRKLLDRKQMNHLRLIIVIILFLTDIGVSHAQKFSKESFQNPPIQYWPKPLWFWNNTTVEAKEIEKQMQSFKDSCGYGGFGILPFGKKFKPEYLSDEYFSVYGKALEKAKELGLTMCLFDEFGFPSGGAGAVNGDDKPRFALKYPTQTIKRLDKIETEVKGPSFYTSKIPEGTLMGIVAMESKTLKRIDLTPNVKDGELKWNVLPGNWKIMIFMCIKDGDPILDYLNPEAVRNFIKMTHDAYYDRFKEYFGSIINGTFFDEPTMYRADGRMWTEAYNIKFKKKFGFSPVLLYPALWYDIGTETQSARNYLFGFRTELYAEGFTKEVNDWSIYQGVTATGHQDNEELANPVSVSGDLMKCFKYLEVPGVDKIGGNRPAEDFYKIISSAANNWDRPYVMSETYGAMGNLSWNEMISVAMDQYSKGINILIPHAVWYDNQNVTFKPELSQRNPIYRDSLKIFNLFLSRLNMMFQNKGRHVADIAVLYPISSLQGEHYFDGPLGFYKGGVEIPKTDYIDVTKWLTNIAGKDFTYLHPEVLDEKCEIIGKKLHLQNITNWEDFQILIIPSCKTITITNIRKIKSFCEKGGTIIFTTQLPSKSVEQGKDNEVLRSIRSIFPMADKDTLQMQTNRYGGKAFYLPHPNGLELRQILDQSGIKFDVDYAVNQDLRYLHKVIDNRALYYFANMGSVPVSTSVNLRGTYNLEVWDPHTGEIHPSQSEYVNGKTVDTNSTMVQLNLKPHQSCFLINKNN